MFGIEDHQVRASAFGRIGADTHEVAAAFRRGLALRGEAALRQLAARGRLVQLHLARGVIHARIARTRPLAGRRIRILRGQEAVAVGHGVVAIVLARQCADVTRIQRLDVVVLGRLLRQVRRQARDVAGAAHRIPARTIAHGHERERIRQRHLHVDVELLAVVEAAHHVRGAALRSLDPLDVLAIAAAAEIAEVCRLAADTRTSGCRRAAICSGSKASGITYSTT